MKAKGGRELLKFMYILSDLHFWPSLIMIDQIQACVIFKWQLSWIKKKFITYSNLTEYDIVLWKTKHKSK